MVPLMARSFWGGIGETAELLLEGSLRAFGSGGVGGVGGAFGGGDGSVYASTVTSQLDAAVGTLGGNCDSAGNAKAASAAAVAPGSEQPRKQPRKGLRSEARSGLRGDLDSRPLCRRSAGDLEDAPGERAAPGGSNICTSKFSASCFGSLLGVRVRAEGDGEAPVHMELHVLNLLGIGGVRGGDRPGGSSPRGLLPRMPRVLVAAKGI